MINPPPLALRRRAEELYIAAQREFQFDPDAAALLLFYAAECGLKSIYMTQNNLKDTADTRGSARPVRSYVHNLIHISIALRMPNTVYAPIPNFIIARTGGLIDVSQLHQAWRYGERIVDTHAIYHWLLNLFDWVKRNR